MSKTAAKLAPVTVQVLWMDDEPQTIENYRRLLERDKKLVVKIVDSIDKADKELKTGKYAAFVADCKMDPHDPSENGAAFLHRLNERRKPFPTFVYSAWTDDPLYKDYLDQSYALIVESKPADWEYPLLQNQFFSRIYESGKRYSRLKDIKPEKIPFNDYVKNPMQYRSEVEVHWDKHGNWISKEMRKRAWLWSVVCGEQLVNGSGDLFDYPSEQELFNLGEAHNLIPFGYSLPLLPEDNMPPANQQSSWSGTEFKNDYYPTINVLIGGKMLKDDFDTGAYQTFISEGLVTKGLFEFFRQYEGIHLDQSFEFTTKKIKLSIVDFEGNTEAKDVPVAVVRDWLESPFTMVNKNRKALFGRDLLRAFQVEVSLDSKNKITRIRFLLED
jgi:CheY-like chemotaxis protein